MALEFGLGFFISVVVVFSMIVIMGFIASSLLLLPEQLKTGGLPITSRPFCSPWKTARSTDDYTSLTLQCQLNPKTQLANQVICVVLHCLTMPHNLYLTGIRISFFFIGPCTSQVTSDAMSGNRSVIQRVMSMRCCTDPQSLAAGLHAACAQT